VGVNEFQQSRQTGNESGFFRVAPSGEPTLIFIGQIIDMILAEKENIVTLFSEEFLLVTEHFFRTAPVIKVVID
jgi:hypothetical protein